MGSSSKAGDRPEPEKAPPVPSERLSTTLDTPHRSSRGSSRGLGLAAVMLVAALTACYSGHFTNGFYFDDIHTIVNNAWIRDLGHAGEYFTNLETFGTMPTNRGYRPMVTLLNAVDYALAGGRLDPRVFHAHIYLSYLLLGGLLYLFVKGLLETVDDGDTRPAALGITAFYLFHTANAETINYIISRSDGFSTLCIVATLVIYQQPRWRRYQLHLIPLVVGLFTKEVGFMAVPLLVLYRLLFVEQALLGQFASRTGWLKLARSLWSNALAIVVGLGLLYLNLVVMTDPARLSGGLAHPRLDYLTTQFEVVSHYLLNFVCPLWLSADPHFAVNDSWWEPNEVLGLILISGLLLVALHCLRRRVNLPVGFGLLWFFGTLAPTSTINPLHQVANDHRTFLPYIGLCLASGWLFWRLYRWARTSGRTPLVYGLTALATLVLALHAYGITVRTQVWSSAESLWSDAVAKGPEHGRALMNLGLVRMSQGRYPEARELFERALVRLPTWPYTHLNMAILLDATGDQKGATHHFSQAMLYGSNYAETYYFTARWHRKHGRLLEAQRLVSQGLAVSPKYTELLDLDAQLGDSESALADRVAQLEKRAAASPTTELLIELSLLRYQASDFAGSADAARRATELAPQNPLAWNNLCSAYAAQGLWTEAVAAGERAVALDPDFERARNNLQWAQRGLAERAP